jgi:uncharacterized integral membrane protein (TIGR00697 family)
MKHRELVPYIYLGIAFHAALVAANVIAAKIAGAGGVFVPAGVLAYSITFPLADVITEVWGREKARVVINAGIVTQMLVWALVWVAIALPPAPFWPHQDAYATVLGQSNRIIAGSLVAYYASQHLDVWIFAALKRLTGGRWLWLRNAVSTMAAQTLDTVIFILIAFYGLEGYPIGAMIVTQMLVKYAIAALDTPLVYLLVFGVRAYAGLKPRAGAAR